MRYQHIPFLEELAYAEPIWKILSTGSEDVNTCYTIVCSFWNNVVWVIMWQNITHILSLVLLLLLGLISSTTKWSHFEDSFIYTMNSVYSYLT